MKKRKNKSEDDEGDTVSPATVVAVIGAVDAAVSVVKKIVDYFKGSKSNGTKEKDNQQLIEFILAQEKLNESKICFH